MDRHTVVQTLHVLLDSTGEWDLDQPVGDPDEAMPKVALPAAIQEFSQRMIIQVENFNQGAIA